MHSYSKDGAMRMQQRVRPGVRAELLRRPAAPTPSTTDDGGHWYADGEMVRDGVHAARRRTTTGARPAPWSARSSTTQRASGWSSNIVGHLLNGVSEPVLQRAFEYWRNVDKDLGDRVEAAVRAEG